MSRHGLPRLLLPLVFLAAACTGDPPVEEEVSATPAFEVVECPDDVAGVVIGQVECGQVEVPARRHGRSDPAHDPVELFVVRISPPGDTRDDEPVLVAGTSLGAVPNYLGIAPLAQRTGREVIIVDPRGTGHSRPSLDCPEVHEAAAAQLAQRSGDRIDATLVRATESCHARLTGDGIDVSAFGIVEAAADLDDVRKALGIERWTVASYGSTSRIVAELVRRNPEPVSAVLLDSPLLPGMDPLATARPRLSEVVATLLDECSADDACERRHGGSDLTLEAALRTAAVAPIPVRVGSDRVMLDGELTWRVLRQVTSDGGSSGITTTLGAVPSIVRQIVDRDTERLNRGLGPVLRTQEPFCLGRSPSCLAPRHHLSVGAWLTITCGDLLPTAAPAADPLGVTELCHSWPVEDLTRAATDLVSWHAPTLIAVGRYGTYSPLPDVRAAARKLEDVAWLVDPAGGNNVIPRTPCTLAIRDAWLRDPTGPRDTSCLAAQTLDWVSG